MIPNPSTCHLLFTPSTIPYAEVSSHFLNPFSTLKLGISLDLLKNHSLLTIDKSPLLGKITITRYFSRLGKSNLYENTQNPSLIDEWIELVRSKNIKTIFEKITLLNQKYVVFNQLTIADLLAWDLIKSLNIKVSDPVKKWMNGIESLPPVQLALSKINETLNYVNINDTIRYEIAKQIKELLGASANDVSIEFLCAIMEQPKDKSKGDLSVPLPRLRIKNFNLNQAIPELCKKFKFNELIIKATPAGPFMNFFLDKDKIKKMLINQIQTLGSDFGKNQFGLGKFAIVEFSSPNIAKPFHAGHLRSTIIGAFTRNVLDANGWDTLSMNYLGDWGKQYGLLAIGYEKYGSDTELEKDAIRHLFDVYVKINADASADEAIHEEARLYFKRMEDGDSVALSLWQRFRDLSITKYKEIYSRLNVTFDVYSGESQYSLGQMKSVLDELKIMELLIPDKGALMVDLKQYDLGAAIIGKTDGSMLYLSRDIAANIERKKLYNFDEMFYVVGSQQEHHFKQLFKILELMGKDWAGKCRHINFGMIKSKDGNMSTRKGSVVFLEDILNHVKEEMHTVMRKNEAKYAQVIDPENVSDVVGMSAIMIQDMSARRNKDYDFDWNRMLSFEGDTGPYLQYAHARLCSIERGAFEAYGKLEEPNLDLLCEPKALALVDQMLMYPDVVRDLCKNFEPCNLVSYTLRLSHAVSQALDSLYVLNRERDVASARLAMYSSARVIIGNSLKLLGLKPLEQMQDLELLIIGLGWTGDFIRNYFNSLDIPVAATTTTGRDNTILFKFNQTDSDLNSFKSLPNSKNIILTFPLIQPNSSKLFITQYIQTHTCTDCNFILLGSTRPWINALPSKHPWIDSNDPIDPNTDPLRTASETQWMELNGCVLNLAGLWGGSRKPKNWVSRIAPTKEQLKDRTSVHLIHGLDIARAVASLIKKFTAGKRWILTDQRVYDWWDMVSAWGNNQQKEWVQELMDEFGINALPRSPLQLKRAISSNDFWKHFSIFPIVCRIDEE